MEVFSDTWTTRFREEINRSESFRLHGASWQAPITLEMSFRGSAEPRRVMLDLHDGSCRSATCRRHFTDTSAKLVIRTDVGGWKRILAGKMDPIWGIMSGKLKLVRGSLSDLIPFAKAAKALVESAARIDARFPPPDGP
jgi:putative sterol carrier protein